MYRCYIYVLPVYKALHQAQRLIANHNHALDQGSGSHDLQNLLDAAIARFILETQNLD